MRALISASRLFYRPTGRPEVVTFFTTNKCNASCSFCIIKDELNVPTKELKAEELSLLAQKLPGLQLLILTGGEPFLFPHLAHLINELDRHKKVQHISVPTNGTQPEKLKDLLDKIELKNIQDLTISLSVDDSFEAHEVERGLPEFQSKSERFIHVLKSFQTKFKGRLLFHVATVYSSKNQDRMENILSWIEERLSPDSMGLTLVRPPAPFEFTAGLDLEKYERLNTGLGKKSASQNFLFFGHLLHREKSRRVSLESRGQFISKCFAGSMNIVIWANGDVSICEKRNSATGNLRVADFDLLKICKGGAHQSAIKEQLKDQCACGHECFVTPNILYDPISLAGALWRGLFSSH